MSKRTKNIFIRTFVLLFWILVWEIAAILVNNRFLLVGPIDTMICLWNLIHTADFWNSILQSMIRILGGLIFGGVCGICLATLCWKLHAADLLFRPVISALKTIPVASFVILLLIWVGNSRLAFWISALVVLPIMYFNTSEGWHSLDKQMLEMSACFHIPIKNRLHYIYMPQLYPYLLGGLRLALGMCWKSGVAAEVIGQPLHSIGNGMYRAKITLETGNLLAWTIVIVFLSYAFEKMILYIIRRLSGITFGGL